MSCSFARSRKGLAAFRNASQCFAVFHNISVHFKRLREIAKDTMSLDVSRYLARLREGSRCFAKFHEASLYFASFLFSLAFHQISRGFARFHNVSLSFAGFRYGSLSFANVR